MGDEVSTTPAQDIAAELRQQILAAKLEPGTPVDDAGLAAELDTDPETLQDAFTALAAEGLLETLPDKTRRIAIVDNHHAIQLLDVLEVVLVALFERAAPQIGRSGVAAMRSRALELEATIGRGDMPGSYRALLGLIRIILDSAEHDELRAVNEYVLARSLGRLYLYRRAELYFIWTDGWKESVALLEADEPDAAVRRLRQAFWILTEELRAGSSADA
ncbi:GntR family transcriptional regulator [Arthrobacter crystallopoietes BAB-32]|uniref:GntR family transcriptional regulator n=1 Tax=Arthrobacter crystallopoietes BAB-32 TaxID=1246476 RepID=N1V3Z6_9MICC|nr:GntR family transcriptional regulator [Arthrobacter crystallopoietes]EMY34734.1 GntR family transcriptional regulator [Arthrobacter crystallopoietes BAB-32]